MYSDPKPFRKYRKMYSDPKPFMSNPVKNINDVSGTFRSELDYLIGKGLRLSQDGTRLIK